MHRLYRIAMCFVIALCGCDAAVDAIEPKPLPSPGAAIVINPDLFWATSTCGWPVTPVVRVAVVDGAVRFENYEPNWRHIWLYQQLLQIDPQRYPIAVLRYRASGIKAGQYLLWMDDGDGPMGGGVSLFQTKDVINDGQVHELRADVRTLKADGNLRALWVALHHDEAAEPAVFELLALRFETAPDGEPTPPAPQRPITLRIVDEANQPLSGAAVTLDYSFANWAQTGVSDAAGQVTLTPLATPDGVHMARVSKFGYVTREVHGTALDRPIVLQRATYYGGTILDETGEPVANAVVRLELPGNDYYSSNGGRMILPWNVLSDARGRWRSPPLPQALDALGVGVVHVDFAGDSFNAWRVPAPIDELRQFTFVRRLSRGFTVSGIVVDEQDRPLGGANVRFSEPNGSFPWREIKSDNEGRFQVEHMPAGPLQIVGTRKNFGKGSTRVEVAEQTPQVRLVLKQKPAAP